MIKNKNGEIWKQMSFNGYKLLRNKYAISSFGRVASYMVDVCKDGKLLMGSVTSGYRTLNLHIQNLNGTIYIHRQVAKNFCTKPTPSHKYVIHINHNKKDNRHPNLKWATAETVAIHQQKSPEKIAYKKRQANRTTGLKLTATQVRKIKNIINNPNRRLTYKQLAAKYMVSEMTLFRIKSGENWNHIK